MMFATFLDEREGRGYPNVKSVLGIRMTTRIASRLKRRALGVWLTGPNKAIPGARRTLGVRVQTALLGANENDRFSEAQADKTAREATADCALARARYLVAVGRASAGQALRRNAWRLGRSRTEMIALTFQAAAEDDEFRSLVEAADQARDNRQWPEACALYEKALALHPLHFGYRVQHAHMLKEQDRFEAAEVDYRDALALGAPSGDVLQHLEYVCQRQHHYYAPPSVASGPIRGPLDERPARIDIEALAYALWHEDRVSDGDMLKFMRSCSTGAQAAVQMMSDMRFRQKNSPLFEVLGAQR